MPRPRSDGTLFFEIWNASDTRQPLLYRFLCHCSSYRLRIIARAHRAPQLISIYLVSEWLCHKLKSRKMELPINSLMMELSGIKSLSRGRNH